MHVLLHHAQEDRELERQLTLSEKLIQEHVGSCRYFSCPNGKAKDISSTARRLCQEAGYDLALSTIPGEVTPAS